MSFNFFKIIISLFIIINNCHFIYADTPGQKSIFDKYNSTPNSEPLFITPSELDRCITETIKDPEYAWRLPREQIKTNNADSSILVILCHNMIDWLKGILRPILHILKKFIKWLEGLFNKSPQGISYNFNWQLVVQILMFTLLATSLSVLIIIFFRMWKKHKPTSNPISAKAVLTTPIILDEDVSADQLPMNEWLSLSHELLQKGETRLAIRAMFLACLAHLANNDKITISKYKSNREYIAELQRKAHDYPVILTAFLNNIFILEKIWYGTYPVTSNMINSFSNNKNAIFNELKNI